MFVYLWLSHEKNKVNHQRSLVIKIVKLFVCLCPSNSTCVLCSTGGYNLLREPLATVEALDLSTLTWTAATPLPFTTMGASMVASPDETQLFHLGGANNVDVWSWVDGHGWEKMAETLENGNRAYSVIMTLPDESLFGCA